MAVAAPARKTAPAPPPSRTAPPPRRKAAPVRPAPQKKAAPARRPRSRPTPKGTAASPAPARRAPARTKTKTKRAVGGQLIPLAGRTAVAVGQLPDSGLVVRMTRGRAWIGVLGVLLVGIVALNVVTLSFAASSGKIDEQRTAVEQDISVTSGRVEHLYGIGSVRGRAASLGLTMPASTDIHFAQAGPDDVATAAQRLAAAAPE
jgi:hypothetical protein